MKRVISVFLAVVMIFTALSFPVAGYGASTDAYISNGKYYRWSDGAFVECMLDFDEMIEQLQEGILSFEKTEFHFMLALPDGISTSDDSVVAKSQTKLQDKIENSLFTLNSDNPRLGMYLFKNINLITCSAHLYPDKFDTPVDDVKYNTYGITIVIEHLQTKAEEAYVSKFAEVFTDNYIPSTADAYTRVKIIYDFVVRNCAYDYDVFADGSSYKKFSKSSDRNRISRSSYGVLVGNRLSYKSGSKGTLVESSDINKGYNLCSSDAERTAFINRRVNQDFDEYFESKTTVTGERVVKLDHEGNHAIANGLAVCEGYSQLFCYLCRYNGVDTRIVDGDYMEYISSDSNKIKELYGSLKSERESDPHEWNYVLLDDHTGKGERWYIVDATFGAQLSIEDIDYNNYDYFLIGTKYRPTGEINPYFSVKNHQQPYAKEAQNVQLYDWYKAENLASDTDYNIRLADLNSLELGDNAVIIQRKTTYGSETKYAYILQSVDTAVKVTIDENTTIVENVGGFGYNGKTTSQYRVIIPYMAGLEYASEPLTGVSDVGQYEVTAKGKKVDGNQTSFKVRFNIVSIDMSNDSSEYSEIHIDRQAGYNGNALTPNVLIIDGHHNVLTDKDYDIKAYKDGKITELKDMGDYDINIVFKGNYKGIYSFVFTVGKVDLSKVKFNEYELPYIPSYYRKQEGVYQTEDYFNANISHFMVGDLNIHVNTDYEITSSGSIDNYGDSGKITISAVPYSSRVEKNTKNSSTYKVCKKFDLSGGGQSNNGVDLNDKPADSNSENHYFYNGKAQKPTEFDYLDKYLERNKDYKIVSYSNNINAGKAFITIEGINGCRGKAKMYFIINPADITKAKVKTTLTENDVKVSVTYDGKTLKSGTDYNKTVKKTNKGYLVTIKGINNYAGAIKHSVTMQELTKDYIAPTKNGNKVKLLKSSYVYNGSECKPGIEFKNGNGQTIDPYYYTVKYSSNVNVGTAKVVVKLRNGFEGSITIEFKIKPKATTISSLTPFSKGLTVKWKKVEKQVSGYQIQYSENSNFSSSKTITVSGNATTSAKIKKLSGGKKYYVRVRTYKVVNGKKYYSSWSTAKSVKTKK